MLKYLVQITEDLVAVSIVIGMLSAYVRFHFPEKMGNIFLIGSGIAGLVLSVMMTYLVNTSNAISKKLNLGYIAYIDLYTFAVIGIAFLLFMFFSIGFILKKTKIVGEIIECLSAAVMIIGMMFYSLPAVFGYPFNFDLADDTIFSTDFIMRFSGMLIGGILVLVTGIAAYKIEKNLRGSFKCLFMNMSILVLLFYYGGVAVKLILSRRIIRPNSPSFHTLFKIVQLTNNYSEYFIFGTIIALLLGAVFVLSKNIRVSEEYSNPAQLRKIKARMMKTRRWVYTLVVATALCMVNLTVVDAYNNKEPDEAPVEECIEDGDNLVVPYSLVEDGHLHRFGYKTDKGILVKFIVVQKPGSGTYGVGLDACDICGDAGYYERNDQIVCRRCDVVMNKNTIGFKGGCNPIVIDFHVEDAKIYVPKSTLIEHQDEFK